MPINVEEEEEEGGREGGRREGGGGENKEKKRREGKGKEKRKLTKEYHQAYKWLYIPTPH